MSQTKQNRTPDPILASASGYELIVLAAMSNARLRIEIGRELSRRAGFMRGSKPRLLAGAQRSRI